MVTVGSYGGRGVVSASIGGESRVRCRLSDLCKTLLGHVVTIGTMEISII